MAIVHWTRENVDGMTEVWTADTEARTVGMVAVGEPRFDRYDVDPDGAAADEFIVRLLTTTDEGRAWVFEALDA